MACPETQAPDVLDPNRWGLPQEAVGFVGERLRRVWERFRGRFRTKTRDTSEQGWTYLRGILTMDRKRNYANIARRVRGPEEDGQNLQQFMSDSPWSAQGVLEQIRAEVIQRPELQGGMLTLDESGDECSGATKAGASRQWLGREGKVDLGQVGVGLGYYQAGVWMLLGAELFLPECWFDEEHAELRQRWHIPTERAFQTKPAIGLEQILGARDQGLDFEVVGCDSLYGRSGAFRASLQAEKILYMADLPCDYRVYLEEPQVGVPPTPEEKPGRPLTRWQVLNEVEPHEVRDLVEHPELVWQEIKLRFAERGWLTYPCATCRVWTLTEEGKVLHEWLLLRREPDDSVSFSLSNAPADTPLATLARWRGLRYFAERIFQDAKSEGGWDELEARKYRAWMHHTALDALALWFIAETKLDWALQYPRDPTLTEQLQLPQLPALSMANVRELLKAVLPLDQLSPQQATDLVVRHLVHRSRSTASRLRNQEGGHDSS